MRAITTTTTIIHQETLQMTNKVVVIYSGGMDSFTVLNRALKDGKEVYALSFDYGQRHVKELECASKVCNDLGVHHKVIDISAINQLLAGSSLTDDIEIPEGHYEAFCRRKWRLVVKGFINRLCIGIGDQQRFVFVRHHIAILLPRFEVRDKSMANACIFAW